MNAFIKMRSKFHLAILATAWILRASAVFANASASLCQAENPADMAVLNAKRFLAGQGAMMPPGMLYIERGGVVAMGAGFDAMFRAGLVWEDFEGAQGARVLVRMNDETGTSEFFSMAGIAISTGSLPHGDAFWSVGGVVGFNPWFVADVRGAAHNEIWLPSHVATEFVLVDAEDAADFMSATVQQSVAARLGLATQQQQQQGGGGAAMFMSGATLPWTNLVFTSISVLSNSIVLDAAWAVGKPPVGDALDLFAKADLRWSQWEWISRFALQSGVNEASFVVDANSVFPEKLSLLGRMFPSISMADGGSSESPAATMLNQAAQKSVALNVVTNPPVPIEPVLAAALSGDYIPGDVWKGVVSPSTSTSGFFRLGTLQDSDEDGLTDAFELLSSFTDPDLWDSDGDGFSDKIELENGWDAFDGPEDAIVICDGIASQKLFDEFSLESAALDEIVWSRTFEINRDGGWQQFFLSGDAYYGAPWWLDGMVLEWSDSEGASGSATDSYDWYWSYDSLRLELSKNSPQFLTISLRAVATNSLWASAVHLLEWSPGISVVGAAGSSQDGAEEYNVVIMERDVAEVSLAYNLSPYFTPHWGDLFGGDYSPLDAPLGTSEFASFVPISNQTYYASHAVGGVVKLSATRMYKLPRQIREPIPTPALAPTQPPAQASGFGAAAGISGGGGGGGASGGFSPWIMPIYPHLSYGLGVHGSMRLLKHYSERGVYTSRSAFPFDSPCLRHAFERNWDEEEISGWGCVCVPELTFETGHAPTNFFASGISLVSDGANASIWIATNGVPVWSGFTKHETYNSVHEEWINLLSNEGGCGADGGACHCTDCLEADGDSLGSARLRILLGEPVMRKIPGFLWIDAQKPMAISRDAFTLSIREGANVTQFAQNGVWSIICNDEGGRTLTMSNIANGVLIRVERAASGLDDSWEVTNPNGNISRLRFRKLATDGVVMSDRTYECIASSDGVSSYWTQLDNYSKRLESKIISGDLNDGISNTMTTEIKVSDASVTPAKTLSHEITVTKRFGFGEDATLREIYRKRLGADNTWIEDFADYYEDGRPRLIRGASRPWEYYEYDADGRTILKLTQRNGYECSPDRFLVWANNGDLHSEFMRWGNFDPDADSFAVFYEYTPLAGDSAAPQDFAFARTETSWSIARNNAAVMTSRRWRIRERSVAANGSPLVTTTEIRAHSATATYDLPQNAISMAAAYDSAHLSVPHCLRGKPVFSVNEDGARTEYTYEHGVWNAATRAFTPQHNGMFMRETTQRFFEQTPRETHDIAISDMRNGTSVYRATILGTPNAGLPVLNWTSSLCDAKNRLISTRYSDGTSTTNAYSGDRLLWWQGRDGATYYRSAVPGAAGEQAYAVEELFIYELPYKPTLVDLRPLFSHLYDFHGVTIYRSDAVGRSISATRGTSRLVTAAVTTLPALNTPTVTTSRTEYPQGVDDFRRETDARGVVTENELSYFTDSEMTETRIFNPDYNLTYIKYEAQIRYRNGSVLSYSASDEKWTLTTDFSEYTSNGKISYSLLETSDSDSVVANSITHYDFLGRVISTDAAGIGGARIVVSNVYDGASSRILSSAEYAGAAPHVVQRVYNALGDYVGSIQNNVTNLTLSSFTEIGGEIWRVTTNMTLTAGIVQMSFNGNQLTGLSDALRSCAISIAANGTETFVESTFNPQNSILTTTTFHDIATPIVFESKFGREVSRLESSSLTRYYYDSLGRRYLADIWHPSGSPNMRSEILGIDQFGDTVWSRIRVGSGIYVNTYFAFDAFGRLIATTNCYGEVVRCIYDSDGQIVSTDGDTYPVDYEYDALGRRTALSTTRNGSARDKTSWEYAAGSDWSPLRKIYADGSAISYEYAPDGKFLRTVRASGRWSENHYDSQNRLTSTESGTISGLPDATSSFTYGSLSRLASASNSVASYAYARSTLGVVTNETAKIGAFSASLERGIDDRSRVSSLSIAPSTAEFYAYDSESRLSTISNSAFSLTYSYGQARVIGYDIEIAGTSLSNSVLTRSLSRVRAYPERISEINHAFNGTPLSRRINNYDFLGCKTSELVHGVGSQTNLYAYNSRSEIAGAGYDGLSGTLPYFEDWFNYDGIGNLTSAEIWGEQWWLGYTSYDVNELNQYIEIARSGLPPYEPEYDIDGNLISNGNLEYAWDSAGRLAAVYSDNACVVSNAYDSFSRRIMKTTPDATHTFVYNGWNPIFEIITHASGTTTTNQYFWGLDLSGSTQGAGGVGGLVAVSLDGTLYFPLSDSNGNITEYVDASGTIVAQYRYDAFGNLLAESGTIPDAFSFRFSTKYRDPETGLYYYGYRFYSPELRRWINRDPIEERGGVNLYGFCGNDGVNGFDMLGRLLYQTGKYFKIQTYPHFEKKDRPPNTPPNVAGEVNVLSARVGPLSRWESQWHLEAEPVRYSSQGCVYVVWGTTALSGTVWWDENISYTSQSSKKLVSAGVHENRHISIWSDKWARYTRSVREAKPDNFTTREKAENKVKWIQWMSAAYFALAQIENGRYDWNEYGMYMTMSDRAMLWHYVNYYNLLLTAQPERISGVTVTVELLPEPTHNLPTYIPAPISWPDDITVEVK